jgi:hypothetical protein
MVKIQLSGNLQTLNTLSELFNGEKINIFCDKNHKDIYYLSGDLKINIDVDNIHLSIPLISNIINEVNFICNFVMRNYTPVSFAHIWVDETCYSFVEDDIGLKYTIQEDNINRYKYEKILIDKILSKKNTDGVLMKILQSLFEYDLDWVNLYRILELIESQKIDIVKKNWISRAERELFKWTANSPEILGIKSRHGKQTHKSPENPMTIFQARYLIKNLIIKYIME